MPGRWAAPPAPAMMTLKPAALAPLAKANSRSGVRWAETMRFSQSIPSTASVSAAWRMVSQSDWLPMMMATAVISQSIPGQFFSGIQKHRPIIGLAFVVARCAEWAIVSWSMAVAHEEETETLCTESGQTPDKRREGGDQTRSGRARQARKSAGEIAVPCRARRPETDDTPAEIATGKGPIAHCRAGSLGRSGFPARHPQPA